MRLLLLAALANAVVGGHVAVRMPFLNPAGVTYHQGHFAPQEYQGYQQNFAYEAPVAYAQAPAAYAPAPAAYAAAPAAYAPAPAAYAQVPVAVPTVQHVPAVADVPVAKLHAQPAVVQKIVEVAKPAVKTRKFEVRRPAIQKQFYDIEERTIIRPVGSALVELDEPLSKAQTGPAVITSTNVHGQQEHVIADHHQHVAEHHVQAVPVAVAPAVRTVAITPVPHHHQHHDSVVVTPASYSHDVVVSSTPAHYAPQQVIVSSTPAPVHYAPQQVVVASTPAPIHYAPEHQQVYDDSEVVHSSRTAYNDAVARYHAEEAHRAHVEAHAQAHEDEKLVDEAANVKHISSDEAHENQRRLLKLLTARGGVAEVGFGREGPSEHVGDAGISRARVLSATPSPHHEPVEEKVKTRRIVVSKPVQTLQEIEVIEPATKLETVAVNQPAVIKTAHVGLERVHTSVPVYGKALAHAQVPVGYYHH